MMNLEHICKKVVDLSREVGNYLREENKFLKESDIRIKGSNDFVTYVDKESERQLIEKLTQILPNAGFLTEEGSIELNNEEFYWVIDPLDGTTNYIHHLSPYAISIGLMQKNEVLLGCVYEVTLDEAFYAWKDGKSWLNGKEIKVSLTDQVERSLIGHGIPYKVESKYDYLRKNIYSLQGKCTLRHLGSAASELCYVASGRLEAYVHDNLSAWDVAAGSIILKEAGGNITDFSGGSNFIFGRELFSTNGLIHAELENKLLRV